LSETLTFNILLSEMLTFNILSVFDTWSSSGWHTRFPEADKVLSPRWLTLGLSFNSHWAHINSFEGTHNNI
jgi:hypothetical protein